MENTQKRYNSKLNIKKSVGKKGEYVSFTMIGSVKRPTLRDTQTGKTVASTQVAINGRGKYIQAYFPDVPADANDTIWADVSAWDKTAEYLCGMFDQDERRTLVMCGSMADKSYEKDGRTIHRLSLTLDAFWGFGAKHAPNGAQNTAQAAPAQNAAPAAPAQNASQSASAVSANGGGFLEMEELDDDDVPF